MSSLVGFALALMLAAVPLDAQDRKGQGAPGGRPGGGFGGAMGGGFGQVTRLSLVSREQVATEIKLTAEEKTKIADLNKEIPSFRPAGNTKDLSQDERKKLATENMEKRAKATAEAEKKLDGILKPEQSKRLDEIYIQQRGIQALKDEKVAKALKLSEEQVGKIDGALKWGTDERTKLYQGNGGGRPSKDDLAALREKQEKLQKEVDGKVLASLTDAQKEQFEKMKGTPFTLERTGGRQGGPGAPGGGGNRKGAKDA
jgi:hypothetical protein